MTGRILLIFPSFPPSLLYSCSTRWGVCWISILLLRHISALPLPVLTFSLFPSLFLLPFPLTERNKHVTAHIWPVLSGPRNCTFLFRKVQWGSNDINSGLLFMHIFSLCWVCCPFASIELHELHKHLYNLMIMFSNMLCDDPKSIWPFVQRVQMIRITNLQKLKCFWFILYQRFSIL